jgi:DNA-binding IclR family transcriptional regulator
MRNQTDRNIAEIMRDEMIMRDRIISQLNESPRTIPEIAEALNYPGYDVMIWVMAMWRYGYLEETGKPNAEGYFKYRLTK